MSRSFPSLLALLVLLTSPEGVISQGTSPGDALVNCTLCRDGGTPNDPTARVTVGDSTRTCLNLFDQGVLEITNSSCTFLQARGVDICLCEDELPAVNTNCTLCKDGSALPIGNLEGLPGRICAKIQLDAMMDDPERCGAYQNTVGEYCGCNATDESTTTPICKLCAEYDLPDPLDIDNTTTTLSCGELELEANFPNADCEIFQGLHEEYCCRNVVVPTPMPTSSIRSDPRMATTPTLLLSSTLLLVSLLYG